MTNIDMTLVKKTAEEFQGSVELVNKKIKSIQSMKSRLKKQKSKPTYNDEMATILKEEQLLKEVRNYLEPKEMTVTTMSKDDIKLLNYEETVRALKSIQSKKSLTRYNEDQTEFNMACQIETWLKEHRELVKDVHDTVVRKSDINDIIEHLENQEQQLDKDYVINMLKELINK